MVLSVLNWMTHATMWTTQDEDALLSYNPDDVTPGVLGFGFTGLFALVIIFLGLDMYRRVRRVRYREEIRQEIAAELAAENGSDAATSTGGVNPGATLDGRAEDVERDDRLTDAGEGQEPDDSAEPRDR